MSIQGIGGNVTAGYPQAASDPAQRQVAAPERAANEKPSYQAPLADTQKTATQIQKDDVKKAVDDVQKFVSTKNQDVLFSIDQDAGKTVIKVVDRSTKEILRQFPSEEMLQIAKVLDKLQGLLVKQQA